MKPYTEYPLGSLERQWAAECLPIRDYVPSRDTLAKIGAFILPGLMTLGVVMGGALIPPELVES